MATQWLIIGLFVVNLGLVWILSLSKQFPAYRGLGSLLFLLLPLLMVFPSQPRFELDYFWWIPAGFLAMALGLILVVWSRVGLRGVVAKLGDVPKQLMTAGPYQYVRHPLYLGLMFVLVGWWWVWAAVYAFYFGMIILLLIWLEAYLEEKLVNEKNFNKAFKDYRQETGMFWIK